MKLAILGDLHIGASKDDPWIAANQRAFFENVFFPYIEEHQITCIIQAGDWFDNQKAITHSSLELSNWILSYNTQPVLDWHILVGNHDSPKRDSIKLNALDEHLKLFNNANIYSGFKTVEIGGKKFDFVPWICQDNHDDIMEKVGVSDSPYSIGHFELKGFRFYPGSIAMSGYDSDFLSHYKRVLTGHYHTPGASGDDRIQYLGTPYTLNFNDAGDDRGFWVLDTETDELEFIKNPICHHEKFYFDADTYTPGELEIDNADRVKLWVVCENPVNKEKKINFEKINAKIAKIYEAVRVDYIQDLKMMDEAIELDDSDREVGSQPSINYVTDYVKNLEVDKEQQERLSSLSSELYNEAVAFEG